MFFSRTPYGVRGLKFRRRIIPAAVIQSHSVWSAWIEIRKGYERTHNAPVALRMECVD